MNDPSPSRLILLADGALLHERNTRLKDAAPGESTQIDFAQLPSAVCAALGLDRKAPPKSDCYFFAVGSGSAAAEAFISRISATWTVHTFPLRAFSSSCTCAKPSVRFSTAIAWAIGSVPSRGGRDRVVCISNDTTLVLPLRFARDQGVDAQLAWPDQLGEEARYFAARNEVPTLLLDVGESSMPAPRSSFGKAFLQDSTRSSRESISKSRRPE